MGKGRGKGKTETVTELVPSGVMRVADLTGTRTLELIMWRGTPAVIVDGKTILRHSTLEHAIRKGMQNDDV